VEEIGTIRTGRLKNGEEIGKPLGLREIAMGRIAGDAATYSKVGLQYRRDHKSVGG